jgi:creatinine amidohydrolase
VLLAHKTWPQVEEYLKTNKRLIIPIGSVEQHGPTGLVGTDFLTATDISKAVGEKTKTMVAPSLNYGMASHHMGFSGTATLRPKTLMSVIYDVVESFYTHGFRNIIFVNGHGGNIAIIQAAMCELKYTEAFVGLDMKLQSWWQLKEISEYETKHFGDESGFHATIGEVSVTMYNQKEAFADIENRLFEIERPKTLFPLSPSEMRKHYPDGRMASNPGLATYEHGEVLFDLAVQAIANVV